MLARFRLHRIHGDAGFGLVLAIQVAIIFAVAPLAATHSASLELIEMLRFGLAATMILIVARHPLVRSAVAVAFLATLTASLQWRIGQPAVVIDIAKLAVTIGFDLVVATIVAVAAFRPGRVTVHRILGAVILYLYVALIFASIYRTGALIFHPSFSGLPADQRGRFAGFLYFSLGALTTSGTDQLAPVHPIMRSLASFESVIGQLYPATLLARLVTLHAAGGERR